MMKKILLAVLVAAGSIIFANHLAYAAEEEIFTPFYFPYTAESENWFQPFYHPLGPEKEKGQWFKPFISVREEYDDNIFLTRYGNEGDWITTIQPGFIIQTGSAKQKHKFILDYLADINLFADNNGENNNNHTLNTALQINLNKIRFDVVNMFHYFSERSGAEDVGRIDRTQDYIWPSITFNLNKLDLLIGYNYRMEDYRSDTTIGSFKGQTLTYEDLDRDEHEGTIETAWKLWPKTSLLCTFDYGKILHDTGKKSDSDYYDYLVGLRGEPSAKSTGEFRVGFRTQDYEDYGDDFESIVFDGSWIEKFSSRDFLRLDFKRTTYDTIFQDNAYYESTYTGADFRHDFTSKLYGNLGVSYQVNRYPTEATLDNLNDVRRKDDLWSTGVGVGYKFSKDITFDLKYQYRLRDSNFSTYDYRNNRISFGLRGHF
ncbi:MAG: hypothetical protein FJZ11_02355 [Candidatus Omnitrophica bacterium]|nr:hypothetical protein [Candidatus Omnitrophota bacterium]